jgi:hypothetical protein
MSELSTFHVYQNVKGGKNLRSGVPNLANPSKIVSSGDAPKANNPPAGSWVTQLPRFFPYDTLFYGTVVSCDFHQLTKVEFSGQTSHFLLFGHLQ